MFNVVLDVQVVIELKNDYEVRGIVQQCDEKMNVLLSQVIMTTIQRKEEMYDEMLVKGRSIRYVHFPPFINIHAQVAQYRKKMESNRRKNMPNKIVDKKSLSVNSLQKRKIEEIVLDNTNYEDEESEGEDDYDALDAIGDEQES